MSERKEKFTPRPWITLHKTNVVSPCNGYIARAYNSPLGPIANRYNATLIAAAPEMYEMLRELSVCGAIPNSVYVGRINTLLAKARGEVQE